MITDRGSSPQTIPPMVWGGGHNFPGQAFHAWGKCDVEETYPLTTTSYCKPRFAADRSTLFHAHPCNAEHLITRLAAYGHVHLGQRDRPL